MKTRITFLPFVLLCLFMVTTVVAKENNEKAMLGKVDFPWTHCTCTAVTTVPLKVEVVKNHEAQPIIGTITDKFLLPFLVAAITYWLFKKYDENVKRRQFSTLGVAIIDCLLEEIDTGIKIIDGGQLASLPKKSWDGMSTIPDDVLLRIIATSKHVKPESFHPKEIRIHCKNYFEHISENWGTSWDLLRPETALETVKRGKTLYLKAAIDVQDMLIQCKELLMENEKRKFPK